MNEIKTDIRRALYNWPFLIAVGLMVIAVALGIGTKKLFPQDAGEGLVRYYHVQIIFAALHSDIVLMVLPILCTLPYTTAFVDEFTCGYIKPYLIKCDKGRYIRGKVIAPAVSGGLCLVIGILTSCLLGALIYSPLELADSTAIPPLLDAIDHCVLFFICGALWASIGTLLANVSLSKYMAYASPFVIFYVLVILSERYFTDVYVISPKEWLKMEQVWPMGEWGVLLLILILTIIIGLMNETVIERRISA